MSDKVFPTPADDDTLEVNAADGVDNGHASHGGAVFDPTLLESIVGEMLDADTIRRLREVSGDDMERGERRRTGNTP